MTHVQPSAGNPLAGKAATRTKVRLDNAALNLWGDRPVRWQLLIVFVAFNLIASLLAGAIAVFNARNATEVEIKGSLEVAERFAKETVKRLGAATSGGSMLANLPLHLQYIRHVRIMILDDKGQTKIVLPGNGERSADANSGNRVPAWFAALIEPPEQRSEIPVIAEGRKVGSVVIAGEPGDEIAEVWEDMWALGVVSLAVNVTLFGFVYMALGRLLDPLTSFSAGLQDLGQGRYVSRIERPKVQELAVIADRFNALAEALGEAREENSELYRYLIKVQDDERRHLAGELHDEFGPCLFGIKANAASIQTVAGALENGKAAEINERVRAILGIAERLQTINRRLLKRLRPVVLGQISLSGLIGDLVSEFRYNHPKLHFTLDAQGMERSYGELMDLTIYRSVQEGLTNAVRHANATGVSVCLQHETREGAASRLQLRISDDGAGIEPGTPPGFGLASLKERVRSLGGECSIAAKAAKGTALEITLPLRPQDHCRQSPGFYDERFA